MITPVWIQRDVAVGGAGEGLAHTSREFGDIYDRASEVSCEIEVVAGAATPEPGMLVFNFASVTKPSEFLSVGPDKATITQADFFTAQQLMTCAEQYSLLVPAGGAKYIFVVPNFRSAGKYLHTWFNSDGTAGSVTATVTVSARGRA